MIIAGTSVRVTASVLKDGAACDLTGATVAMRIRRPSGSITDYPATIDNAEGGAVHVDLASAAVDEAGAWSAWADCSLSGGARLVTAAQAFLVYAPGSIA